MPRSASSTKHFQVAQGLRARIRQMSPGETLPTVQELTGEFEVSQGTLVKALGHLRAEGLIHRPSGKMRLLVAEKHDRALLRVAIIRPDWPSPDYEAVVGNIIQAGKHRGWAFDLTTYGSLQNLDLSRATGLNDVAVLLPNSEPFPDHLREVLRRPAKPTVLVYEPVENVGVSSISVDGRKSGRLAVEHLAKLGHRQILAVLSEPPSPLVLERISGWREAMSKLDAVEDVDSMLVDCGTRPGQQSINVAYDYLTAWMERSHPSFTAIFCDCWTGALAVKRILREKNLKIPQDVSVIAYSGEGSIAPFLNPPLTAIEVNMVNYGTSTVEEIARAILGGKFEPQRIRIQPQLQVRESTASITDYDLGEAEPQIGAENMQTV